ncbi:MAG: hypothetical protein K5770_03460 [Lachnospiraceae bacterium]|nr:hypothetical protein [Lachnospiraceae bacterium]
MEKKVDTLIGAEELKRYVNELYKLYYHISEQNPYFKDTLNERVILLSINEGDGLTTWLKSIAGIRGLLNNEDDIPIEEYELRLPNLADAKNLDEVSDRDIVLNTIETDDILYPDYMRLLCIDITKWVDAVDSPAFRAVLSRLRQHLDEQFLVFRIPAVDEVTFRTVKEAIGWFMNVDGLYCPPYGIDDYLKYGMKRLKKQKVVVGNGIEELFREIIAGEKRDPNFCGFTTVRCLADRMVLNALFDKYYTQ